jgi:parvulin-like peptidyl-prolyl isomerase
MANVLYNEIINNKMSFATTAALYSEDPATAPKGGDLGWTEKGMLVAEYENLAWVLPIGTISNPFKTPFGIMILQVVDRNEKQVWTRFILLTFK